MLKFLHKWLLPALTWAIPMCIIAALLGLQVDWRLWAFVWCAMLMDTIVDVIYPER